MPLVYVMEKTTYQDARVVEILSTKVIPVKVDQDFRPDLAHRYEDYGWPATIVFDSEGRELARLSGYAVNSQIAGLGLHNLLIMGRVPSPTVRILVDSTPFRIDQSQIGIKGCHSSLSLFLVAFPCAHQAILHHRRVDELVGAPPTSQVLVVEESVAFLPSLK